MSSDEKKTWGTIFLDASRESSVSKLDAMQAASRQEQWNQRSQQDYLEKVRLKAIDRAREILGEAYTERQSVLEEAERDAERIRAEVKATYAAAEDTRNQAQEIRHSAQAELDNATHIRNAAHEEGFQAGLAQAQEELQNFRMAMGSSVAGVLHVIEAQCMHIFAHWRAQLVDITKASIKHGTCLALSERHEKIVEHMLLEAIRHLDDRRSITLRVNPEDEPVVSDLFAAAKEKNPDLGMWKISPDPQLEPGDIIAESQTGTVDSRVANYLEMVENIVQHLSLQESVADAEALENVHQTVEHEIAQVQAMTPAPPEPSPEEPEDSEGPPAEFLDHPDTVHMGEDAPLAADGTPLEQPWAQSDVTQEQMAENFEMKNFVQEQFNAESFEQDPAFAQHMSPEQVVQDAADMNFSTEMPPMAASELTPPMAAPARVTFDEPSTPSPMQSASEHSADHTASASEPTDEELMESMLAPKLAPTMQELEDELLGDDLPPPPVLTPRSKEEREILDEADFYGHGKIIKDKA